MSRGDLSEAEWRVLRELLPPELGRRGRPLAFHLTGGEAADCASYDTLIDLPESPPKAMLGDKGYDSDVIRADLKTRGIRPVIPPRSNRKAAIRWNKRLYRERNRIERMFGHLKINHAIPTTTTSRKASSECSVSQQPDPGSNPSTQPSTPPSGQPADEGIT